jgi:K+-sensing histidine kinase KdpD
VGFGDFAMGKRVLVAVDPNSVSEASISYGIELAARIQSSLALIAISSSKSAGKSVAPEEIPQAKWMDRAVSESQEKAVSLEIFVASGDFFKEVIRFVRAQPAVRFIVIGLPKLMRGVDGSKFAAKIKHLHEEFEGEILLVEKAGHITRVCDHYLQRSVKGISG